MSNVIQFKRPVQVNFDHEIAEFDFESAARLHLAENIESNLPYLSTKDKDELIHRLLENCDFCTVDQLFQDILSNRESKRERQAQRKHLRGLIQDFIDSEGEDLNAADEFLDALKDAESDGLISHAIFNRIHREFLSLEKSLFYYRRALYSDDTLIEVAPACRQYAEDVFEKYYLKIKASQMILDDYVYYIAR